MITKNQIKFVKSLHYKKYREIHRLFIVETIKNIKELINSKYFIQRLYVLSDCSEFNHLDTEIFYIKYSEMCRISCLKSPSKVLAVVHFPKEIKTNFNGITIALDNIKDPGNLGAIIRNCDWFGVTDIILSENSVDIYNSKVVQSTMGSFFRVNVKYVNLPKTLNDLQKNYKIYATTLDGENINVTNISKNSIIIFGNESNGISKNVLKYANNKITIFSKGNAESLNIASANAIVLYNCFNY